MFDIADAQREPIISPPRLHWALVLVFSCFTAGAFGAVWLAVQASWARKVRGGNITFALSLSYAIFVTVTLFLNLSQGRNGYLANGDGWLGLVGVVLWLASVYYVRRDLVAEPLGLSIGYIMTLLFGPLYFQYYLTDWNASSRSGRPLGL